MLGSRCWCQGCPMASRRLLRSRFFFFPPGGFLPSAPLSNLSRLPTNTLPAPFLANAAVSSGSHHISFAFFIYRLKPVSTGGSGARCNSAAPCARRNPVLQLQLQQLKSRRAGGPASARSRGKRAPGGRKEPTPERVTLGEEATNPREGCSRMG